MIQEDVDGPVAIISKRAFPNKREAERVEQKIHRIFADSNFRQTTKGLGQAGETEWFYMTDMEYACAEFWLWNYHKRRAINQIATAIFLTLFLVIYATSKNTTGNERENNNGRNRSEFYEPWDSSNGQQQPTSSPNDHHARF